MLSDARATYAPPAVPRMPVKGIHESDTHGSAVVCQGGLGADKLRDDHIAISGYCGDECFTSLHIPPLIWNGAS